jgi:hypothetical protein
MAVVYVMSTIQHCISVIDALNERMKNEDGKEFRNVVPPMRNGKLMRKSYMKGNITYISQTLKKKKE